MSDRDRLIELMLNSEPFHERDMDDDFVDGELEIVADHLLANGVIVPPCKVGDTVYTYGAKRVKEWEVCFIGLNSLGEYKFHLVDKGYKHMIEAWIYDIGQRIFLSREDAERALKGGE